MAFFNSSSPAYKSASSPKVAAYAPSAPSSGFASLFGSLLGGSAPAYKTLDGQAARASTSPGLLRIFIGSPPSYKTVERVNPELADEALDDAGEAEDADDACSPPTDTVVLL